MALTYPRITRVTAVDVRSRHTRLLLILVTAALSLWGCAKKDAATTPPLLTETSPSVEALCERILQALAASDTLTLHQVCLTRYEHDSVLVPNMPIGQADVSKDLDFAWYLLVMGRQKGIRRALSDYGGQILELVRVQFMTAPEQYGPLTVHRKISVTVRDETGQELPLGIFGSVVEHHGQFKLVSIVD
ncbi:MAG: hypothetical protein AB1792_09460 [Candidatus Zixiibacteriota bacterium]